MAHELGGVQYWTYHEPTKPVAVFIHGFTGSHEGFQYIIPGLTDFHVIVPDLPGFGRSQPLDKPWTVAHLAKATNDFVRGLNLKQPPYLVSHSMGGLVAANMLAQNPELFDKKTVFISPVATKVGKLESRTIGAFGGALQYRLGVRARRIVTSRTISRLATKLIMTTKDPALRKKIYQHHFDNLEFISSVEFYHKLHVDITRHGALDHRDKLRRFKSLIITGNRDNVTPLKTEKRLAKAIGAELKIVPGVGHLIHYEKPTEAAAAIAGFLKHS